MLVVSDGCADDGGGSKEAGDGGIAEAGPEGEDAVCAPQPEVKYLGEVVFCSVFGSNFDAAFWGVAYETKPGIKDDVALCLSDVGFDLAGVDDAAI